MDSWGGSGFDNCAQMVGAEAERLWYKNNVAAGVAFFSIYMVRLLSTREHLETLMWREC
jgi:hypothetical protein